MTWSQALRWRLAQQYLEPPGNLDAVGVAARLCGVQAQVPSAAELAVAVRTKSGAAAGLATGLASGRLVRTWSARGTLHVLPIPVAVSQLSLLAAARTWHKGSWQRAFAPEHVMAALAEHVWRALDGDPLTREELVATIDGSIGQHDLAERLRSGWSALLKPLAWQGVLCQGPSRGRHISFARPDRLLPDWPGLPDPREAGPAVVRAYLAAFGPATIEAFDAWLLRGATGKAELREWFGSLGDEVAHVDVEGRPAVMLHEDVAGLAGTQPSFGHVHLLPNFDQYVLGPGTSDTAVVPAEHRPLVSRAGGWISAVVLVDGRVAGTWLEVDGAPRVSLFPGVKPPPGLGDALAHMTTLLARTSARRDTSEPGA